MADTIALSYRSIATGTRGRWDATRRTSVRAHSSNSNPAEHCPGEMWHEVEVAESV